METTSTNSAVMIDSLKSIALEISSLKKQLNTLSALTKDVTDTTDSDSIEFLLVVSDIFFKWSTYLRDDIKILTDSVGK